MEWALNQSVFQAMLVHFGVLPVINLLVTPLNSQLPVFFSPFPDPAAFGVDTLSPVGLVQDGVCLSTHNTIWH